MVTAALKLKDACSLEEKLWQCIKKWRHYSADKGPYSRSYGFSSSHVWMWELDYKECWVLKNWYFWTVVFEKTLESPLDFMEIKLVNPKGNQSFASGGQSIGASASASVLPMNIQDWFPLRWTGWISLCPKDSQESSPTQQFKSISSLELSFIYGPTRISIHDYWKNHSLD